MTSPVPPTNAYQLGEPQVSGDGTLLLYTGALYCGEGSSCFLSKQDATTLLDLTTGQQTGVGPNATMSRSGQYLAAYSSGNVFNPTFALTNRSTSATLFQGQFAPATVSIAADGTTVVTVNQALQLIRGGVLTTLVGSNVNAAVIDDADTTIVYQTASPTRLFVMDIQSGLTQELGPGDRDSFEATLSADGQWVAYLSTLGTITQVFFSHLDGSDWQQLTNGSAGINDVTLSGDGTTVFAIAGDGSMLQIDTATGNITTLVGPTPYITSNQETTPGSLQPLQGTGLGDPSFTVTISGVPAPVLSRSATQILFQVPWDTPLSAVTLVIPQGGSPYFEDSAPLTLAPFYPQVIGLAPVSFGADVPFAIHADWSSLVTGANPAALGETVHIYLTGGGSVNPPVATDITAPIQPLSLVTTPFYVVANEVGGEPLGLSSPYFGLAPGLVGVWQLDVTLPFTWTQPSVTVGIEFNSPPPNPVGELTYFFPIPINTGP